jgi:hypothetical protein
MSSHETNGNHFMTLEFSFVVHFYPISNTPQIVDDALVKFQSSPCVLDNFNSKPVLGE